MSDGTVRNMDIEARRDAIQEFRYCAKRWLEADESEKAGREYALAMAAAECELLGIDPSRITPDGYASAAEGRGTLAGEDTEEPVCDQCGLVPTDPFAIEDPCSQAGCGGRILYPTEGTPNDG